MHAEYYIYRICAMSVYRNSCDQWVLQQHLEETEQRICACIFVWKWLVVYITILLINKVGKCYAHSVWISTVMPLTFTV